MTARTVTVDSILDSLRVEEYSSFFDITIGDTTVLSTADFYKELSYHYRAMSFLSYQPKEYDTAVFLTQWTLYKARHLDEWTRIFDDVALTQSETFNPITEYAEIKTITPDIEVQSDTTYGGKNESWGGDSLSHGQTQTTQTNTYDGTLRDGAKTTNGGTDSRSFSNTSQNSGTDSNTTTTTGDTTETKEGYRTNPLENLQKDIDFTFRNNLRELIINNFTREVLFYNSNDDEGGLYYGLLY